MGLDTSHGCWHGAYGAFTRWRNTLAQVAGYDLMDPTPEERAQGAIGKYPMIEWSGIVEKNFQGEWDRTPPDPLIILIAHSDCDGVIHPAQAAPLANRLEELLPKLPDEVAPGHIGHWRDKTQTFLLSTTRCGQGPMAGGPVRPCRHHHRLPVAVRPGRDDVRGRPAGGGCGRAWGRCPHDPKVVAVSIFLRRKGRTIRLPDPYDADWDEKDRQERERICDWLRANGLDPALIPVDPYVEVTTTHITVDMVLLDADGELVDGGDCRPVIWRKTVPLAVPPPDFRHPGQ